MMGRAANSFSSMFDTLQTTKDTYEKGVTDRNTQDFLNQLAQYQSPEALAQAQKAGDVAKLRDQFNMLDAAKTNPDAIQGRVNTLRDRATADYNYQQTLQDRADAPLVDQFQSSILNLKSQDAAPDLRNQITSDSSMSDGAKTKLLGALNSRLDTLNNKNRSDTQWQWSVDKHKRDEATRQKLEAGKKLIGDTYAGLSQSEDSYINTVQSGIQSAADKMGVPVTKLYDPTFRKNMTPEQQQILAETKQRLGSIDQPEGAGQSRKALVDRLVNDVGLDYTDAVSMVNDADKNFAGLTGLSAKAQKDAQAAKQEYETAMKGNSWYQMQTSDQSPADVLAEVTKGLSEKQKDMWGFNKGELPDFINEAVGKGIKLSTPDGGSVNVRLPVGVIKAVINQTTPGAVFDTNPADVLEGVMKNKGWSEEYKKFLDAETQYKKKANTIKARDLGRPTLNKLLQVFQPISPAKKDKPKPPGPDLPAPTARPDRQGM